MPRAKMLGGCSSMNAMIYIRGNKADYDAWAKDGATGWSYADVLPLFRKSENNSRGADEYHGDSGRPHHHRHELTGPSATGGPGRGRRGA